MIQIVKPAKVNLPDLAVKGAAEVNKMTAQYNAGIRQFKFASSIYGDAAVKKKLIKIQHDKCCFCERKISAGEPGHIEHYRPKAGYKADENTPIVRPGYFWLAYEFSNLYYSCYRCNCTYKKNYFPLSDETQRAYYHVRDISREDPLILDPCSDPSRHLIFQRENIKPKGGSAYGKETIKKTGLNRKALATERREYLNTLDILAKIARGNGSDALDAQNHFRTISQKKSLFSYMVICNFPDLV